jgi:hypothetical protein
MLCFFADFGGQVGDPLWCDQVATDDFICDNGA